MFNFRRNQLEHITETTKMEQVTPKVENKARTTIANGAVSKHLR